MQPAAVNKSRQLKIHVSREGVGREPADNDCPRSDIINASRHETLLVTDFAIDAAGFYSRYNFFCRRRRWQLPSPVQRPRLALKRSVQTTDSTPSEVL